MPKMPQPMTAPGSLAASQEADEARILAAVEEARSLFAQKKFPEAKALLLPLSKAGRGNVDFILTLGGIHYHMGELKEAVDLIEHGILLAPDNIDMRNNLGIIQMEREQLEEAEQSFRRVIEKEPLHLDALNNLSRLLLRREELKEAHRLLLRAIEHNPRYSMAHQTMSRVLYQSGHYKEAYEHAKAALTGLGTSWMSPVHIVHVALAYGGKEEAIAVLHWLRENDPDDPEIKHLLSGLEGDQRALRAQDDYVEKIFDRFATSFDEQLEQLDYKAPEFIAALVKARFDQAGAEGRVFLDAGCGTGLCAPLLRPYCGRLEGVDLSEGMLKRAEQRGGYDKLTQGELVEHIRGSAGNYDAIISADTLCYFGVMDEAIAAFSGALKPGGYLSFTVEEIVENPDDDYELDISGRYRHSATYLDRLLTENGFEIETCDRENLRREGNRQVVGLVYGANLTAGAGA